MEDKITTNAVELKNVLTELLKEKQRAVEGKSSDSEEVERLTLQIMERIDKSLE